MESINIHGKEYITVNERIKYFRENYKDGQILTELVKHENGFCIFAAQIVICGKIVAIGHAYEKEGSSYINKTSYIENCETSAIGRALGVFGIGIDNSIASADEVQNAVRQQNTIYFPQASKIIQGIKDCEDIDDFNNKKGWISKHLLKYSEDENTKINLALSEKYEELNNV